MIIAGEERAVAFVADQMIVSTKNVTVAEAGSFIHPMIEVLNCVTDGFALACPPSACIAITNSG